MKRNATSHTMGPILPSTPTQHQQSMRKITHTSIHARTRAHKHTRTHTNTHIRTHPHSHMLTLQFLVNLTDL